MCAPTPPPPCPCHPPEGAGIYRHSRLVRTALLQIGRDGLVARSSIEWRGNSAKSAVLTASATIVNTAAGSVTAGARVVFQLVEGSTGAVAGAVSSAKLPAVASAGSVTASGAIELASPRLWTAQSPALYTVVAELRRGDAVIDAVNVSHGFRDLAFTGADGAPSCTLNRRPFKWRGFCDHSNFAVVGSAVPDRIKLFRSMMSRAVGGNARRTSHNPPDPTMLDIYDRTGTLVMDETRVFNALNSSVDAMAALVRRDRNHPSVGMWSFCNEEACEANGAGPGDPQLGAPLFAAAVRTEDGTRPTAANTPGWHGPFPPYIPTDLLTRNIDIQGFSHAGMQQGDSDAHLDGNPALGKAPNTPAIFHNMTRYRTKPIFGSECCSCNTMRDEDVGCESSNGQDRCIQKSFSADCAQEQSEIYDNAPFVVGTMVWTLFDYLGEPSGTWPNVISSFGQFDVAGFPKAQATWYRAKWLLRSDDGRADKPFRTGNRSVVHLVESWEKPRPTPPIKWSCNRTAFRALCARPKSECEDCVLKHAADMVRFGCSANEWDYLCRTGGAAPPAPPPSPPNSKDVTVYSAAASVELVVNGVSLGIRQLPTQRRTENATVVRTWAEWANVRWAPGNATVIGRDATGEVVAVSTRFTSGAAARIVLSLDAPSARTGTGVALLADGQDTALVRATVVDAAGHKVHDASNVITFSVRSGDGRLVGTHNGRVDSHARSDSDAVPAYHGLARAVVSVTSAAALPQAQRTLLAQIDADSDLTGLDGRLSSDTIVVEASSPGIPSALLSIPVSTAPEHGVLAVAAAAAGNPISF